MIYLESTPINVLFWAPFLTTTLLRQNELYVQSIVEAELLQLHSLQEKEKPVNLQPFLGKRRFSGGRILPCFPKILTHTSPGFEYIG